MVKKDLLGLELKSIMEEDTKDIKLSQASIDRLLSSKQKGYLSIIKGFLNKEIEISFAPAVVGFAAFLFIASVPNNLFKYESKEVMPIENTQVIVSLREVGKR